MTAEVELLPLPEKEQLANPFAHAFGSVTAYGHTDETLAAYARANVAHATAALQAEIKALRAEVTALQREVGALHMHAKQRDQYAVEKAVQALYWKKRAERLAEALRRYGVHDQACVEANIPICTCGLDAALDQENDDA